MRTFSDSTFVIACFYIKKQFFPIYFYKSGFTFYICTNWR